MKERKRITLNSCNTNEYIKKTIKTVPFTGINLSLMILNKVVIKAMDLDTTNGANRI